MNSSNTPPTANNHVEQAQDWLCEPTPVPVDPVIIRASDFGPKSKAAPQTDGETAVPE